MSTLSPCRNPAHHHFIDRLGTFNGVLSGVALYPQVFSIWYWGVENNLSILMLLLIIFNNVVWLLYGIHRSIMPTYIAAGLSLIAGVTLLFI